MSTNQTVVIQPARRLRGVLRLPGDKSISHRYAMLAALAEGKSIFHNFSTGADCASTLACVGTLGAKVSRNNSVVEITSPQQLKAASAPLDCGNSGSTMRMLSGILVGQEFSTELTGDESLSRRPMARIITPLEQMGARIEAEASGRPPLRIHGAGSSLHGISYQTQVTSAQVKSCILFAGLLAEGETTVTEPVKTRDHGELALRAFGAEVNRSGMSVSIRGAQKLRGIEAQIPGDISSAAFFMCAAAMLPDSDLVIENLLLNPTRASLLDVLTQLGAKIFVVEISDHHGELTGTVKIQSGKLKSIKISGGLSSALIDELPVLAAIAPFTSGGIEIRDAAELRVKESDRIAVVAKNLRAMGAQVEELADGLRIPGAQRLQGADVYSEGDHRIAMAFAIAALAVNGETKIHGADTARISFPSFFDALESVVER